MTHAEREKLARDLWRWVARNEEEIDVIVKTFSRASP